MNPYKRELDGLPLVDPVKDECHGMALVRILENARC
jgi:hypothetical protein